MRQRGLPAAAPFEERAVSHQLARPPDGHDSPKAARPFEEGDELSLFERATDDLDVVLPTGVPEDLEADAELIGPEIRDGSERTRRGADRPGGPGPPPYRPPPRPASVRSGSAPRSRRGATPIGPRPRRPRPRPPRTTGRRRATPFSSVSPESSSQSTAAPTPMPTTTTSASTRSPSPRLDDQAAGPRRPRDTVDAGHATPRLQVHSVASYKEAQCAPITGPSTFDNGISNASTTVTRHPSPAQVEATSAPMNPAPITTTRHDSRRSRPRARPPSRPASAE